MKAPKLSINSHVGITADEFQTIKVGSLPNMIYNRLKAKLSCIPGNGADRLLQKYNDRPLKEMAECNVINLWDCFYIIPN